MKSTEHAHLGHRLAKAGALVCISKEIIIISWGVLTAQKGNLYLIRKRKMVSNGLLISLCLLAQCERKDWPRHSAVPLVLSSAFPVQRWAMFLLTETQSWVLNTHAKWWMRGVRRAAPGSGPKGFKLTDLASLQIMPLKAQTEGCYI